MLTCGRKNFYIGQQTNKLCDQGGCCQHEFPQLCVRRHRPRGRMGGGGRADGCRQKSTAEDATCRLKLRSSARGRRQWQRRVQRSILQPGIGYGLHSAAICALLCTIRSDNSPADPRSIAKQPPCTGKYFAPTTKKSIQYAAWRPSDVFASFRTNALTRVCGNFRRDFSYFLY